MPPRHQQTWELAKHLSKQPKQGHIKLTWLGLNVQNIISSWNTTKANFRFEFSMKGRIALMFICFFFGILHRSKLVWAVELLVSYAKIAPQTITRLDHLTLFSSFIRWGISLLAFLAPSGGSVRICAIFPFQLKANCQSVFRFWVVIKLCARELPTPAQSLETEGNFEGGNTTKFLLYLTYAGKHVEEYEKCRRHPLRLRRQS